MHKFTTIWYKIQSDMLKSDFNDVLVDIDEKYLSNFIFES